MGDDRVADGSHAVRHQPFDALAHLMKNELIRAALDAETHEVDY